MKLGWELGSARVPRAPFGVSPNGKEARSARRDAGRGNRDGRAPQTTTVVVLLPDRLINGFCKAATCPFRWATCPAEWWSICPTHAFVRQSPSLPPVGW